MSMRIIIPGIPAVRNADGAIEAEAVAAIQPCLIAEKCALHLKVASITYHYYVSIGRAATPTNMNYTQVLRSFYVEWEALQKLIKQFGHMMFILPMF